VLIGGVVDDQLGDHPQATFVRLGDEALGVGHGPVVAVHAAVFGDVVTVIAAWRRVERQQPDGVDAEFGDVVEFGDQAGKVADPVIVGVEKRFDVNLIDHRILVPERVFDEGGCLGFLRHVKLLFNSVRPHGCPVMRGSVVRGFIPDGLRSGPAFIQFYAVVFCGCCAASRG